ncbi:prohibitin family protein [Pseudoalteromonas ardens]|uniref:Peptidase n=1 Tax=Pseudoalteromonas rubra TaxID=43658 RepID=A0A0L0ENV0_9GAMM|nr:prohibitin family protein [Pseudoalteromonas sp. R96]KNC66084.1 peptidase [Pseudoalteromonas rubra]MDK1309807.1 prohibitin family protein [Pseudoalteromonas sp. R96]
MNIILPPDLALIGLAAACLLILIANLVMRALRRYKPAWRKRILSWRFRAGLTLLICLFLIVALVPFIFIRVDSGEVAVLWKRFGGGTYLEQHFSEGTVLVMPWDKLIIYNGRFQTAHESIDAITKEGLRITLNVTVRYRPVIEHVPYLHQLVGPKYLEEMVLPEVASAVRMIVSRFRAEEVYSHQRLEIQKQLLDDVLDELHIQEETILEQSTHMKDGHALVNLDDMLIKRVDVPDKVHEAIISKVNQSYLNEEYAMRLEVAKKEAQRKKTEAQGIADFQETVSGGISETYLRWRGIEATIELAKSNNAKVVVIGSGKDGLPLILNTESSLNGSAANLVQEAAKVVKAEEATKPVPDYVNSVIKPGEPMSIHHMSSAKSGEPLHK